MSYRCRKCGDEANIVEGEIRRTCDHVGAGVIADIKATVTGTSGINEPDPTEDADSTSGR